MPNPLNRPRRFLCETTGELCVEGSCIRGKRCVEAECTRHAVPTRSSPYPRKPENGRPPGPRESRETDLRWGDVVIPAGSRVRMLYCGSYHYASVAFGSIFDDGRTYSPAKWACKTANNTSRNAWSDLEFCQPGSSRWVLAEDLRAMTNEAFDCEYEAIRRKWEPVLDELRPGMDDAFSYYLKHGFHRDTDADRQTEEKYAQAVTAYASEIMTLEPKYARILKKKFAT